MRLMSVLTLLLVVPVVLADETEPKDKTKPREISVKLSGGKGALKDGTKITNKDDLEKQIADEDVRKEIAKQVDFKKEYLVLFQWAGSGGDKLEMSVEKESATFSYKRGLTRDLRQHAKLFALPSKMEYKLSK